MWASVEGFDNDDNKQHNQIRQRKEKVTAFVHAARAAAKDTRFDPSCEVVRAWPAQGFFSL